MRSILKKMLEDMNQDHVPFTFLMPADEAIYRPFQFAFIYRQPNFHLTEEAEERSELQALQQPGGRSPGGSFHGAMAEGAV